MMKHIYYICMVLCALLSSCGGHSEHHHEAEEHEHEEGVIHLTIEQAESASLATEIVMPGEFEECIRVSGQVTTAQGDEFVVVAKSSGVLTFVRDHLTEGVAVRQGEMLATISASGMQGGDAVAQQTVSLAAAKAAYERAKELVKDTLISRKEYERVKQEYEVARLATSGKQSGGGSAVVAPLTGYVKSIDARAGEYVEAGAVIATVTKSCNLQLRAEVPEKYFKEIGKVRSAYFEMSYGGEIHNIDSLHGHLVSTGRTASEESAYIPVTFEFVNDGCMVPGSFADIWLLTEKRDSVISVPTEAITEEQGLYYVYLQLPQDEPGVLEFEKREVKLGMNNGMRTEVLKGIAKGDKVVTNGVTQVKLAGASGNIPEAHSHNH